MRILPSMIFSVVAIFCALVGIGFIAAASAAGQEDQQRPVPPGTIRVRVNLIPVDVIVTDKNQRPLADLNKEDFTILEDGRPQDIQHFATQTRKSEAASTDARLLLRNIPTLELIPQSNRVFLILLGRGRHQTPFKGVDALIRFVENDLLTQDRVAVFAFNRATDFTTDRQAIVQVLQRYKKGHEQIEAWAELRFGGLGTFYGSQEIPKSWQAEINKIFEADGTLSARQVPPGRVTTEGKIAQDVAEVREEMMLDDTRHGLREGFRSPTAAGLVEGGSARYRHLFERMESGMLTDLSFEDYAATSASTHQDLQNIFTAIEYLRYVEGEKHLLYFTEEGLFLPRLAYDLSVAAMANDARVSIDTFQTGGISETPTRVEESAGASVWASAPDPDRSASLGRSGRGVSWSRSMALDSLRNLSDLTGGRAALHENISKALARVNETTRTEYLLGYYPRGAAWDGKYHRITVKVNRPGLNVRYRHGYYARDVLQPYDRTEFLAYGRISSAAAYESEIGDIPLKVTTAWQKDDSGKKQTRVDLVIDASKVRFQSGNQLYSARLRIGIFYTDSDDRYLGDVWESLDMDLQEDTHAKVMREGIRYSTLLAIPPARRTLKTVVYDIGGDRVGSVVNNLR